MNEFVWDYSMCIPTIQPMQEGLPFSLIFHWLWQYQFALYSIMQSNHQKEEVYISQAEWDLRLGNASNVGLLNSYLFMASQFNA